MIKRIGAAVAVLLITACGGQSKQQNVQPPKEIGASFQVQPAAKTAGPLAIDKYLIGIRRDALEKEFLLRSQIISQALAPSFQGLRSRIVAFREHGNELLMLEATQGHVIDNQTPATLLLAKFNILKEVDGVLYFDLNQGLANMYTTADWYGSDDGGTMYSEEDLFQSSPLNMSYIDEASFDNHNQLVVSQVGQLAVATTSPQRKTTVNMPIKNKIYLTTYQPDTDFQKYATKSDFSQFGYFEVAPMIGSSGYSEVYASKFNVNKPIEYAVSANTPAEFKDAVREGILYWNKAFGREVLKAVDAPEGVRAPDSTLNIVQWVNWDWAGAAYADAQMDPRTGQIMNAQVFMTSAFAVGGKARARSLIRQINTLKGGTRLNLKGFKPSSLCNRTHEQEFADTLTQMVADPKISDQDVLRAAQDYVREVVAHEVGHTLGLRHNFAGSTFGNLQPSNRAAVTADYFNNQKVDPNLITTSSVMDYEEFIDSLVTGHHIKHGTTAMKYDEMAIRHLYDGAQYSLKETPLFCTDSMRTIAMDCMVWDTGASAVESIRSEAEETIDLIPERIMQAFINGKSPAPGSPEVPVERVALSAEAVAKRILDARLPILTLLEKKSRLLTVERQFDAIDPSSNDNVIAAKMDVVKRDLDRFGGLAGALSPLNEARLQSLLGHVDLMINSGNYDKGLDNNNNPYQFSSTELSVIRERTKKVLADAFALMPKLEIKMLGEWSEELANHPLAEDYANFLKSRVDEWLLATSGQTLTGKATLKDGGVIDVSAPVFKYPYEIRSEAAKLLFREGAPSIDWSFAQVEEVKGQFNKVLSTAFADKMDSIKTDGLTRELIRWYLENSEIKTIFDQEKAPDAKSPEKAKIKK